MDMAATAPDLLIDAATTIHALEGTIDLGGNNPGIPTMMHNGIRVFVVKSLTVNAILNVVGSQTPQTHGPPVAIVSYGDVLIANSILLGSETLQIPPGVMAGGSSCNGETVADITGGGGGGGFGSEGGPGGDGTSDPGGAQGVLVGNATLVPLRGGCSGGGNPGVDGGVGGGALQITSRTMIELTAAGDIAANGLPGTSGSESGGAGGGSGGGLLLEAPSVKVDGPISAIGAGGTCNNMGADVPLGAMCDGTNHGSGGDGSSSGDAGEGTTGTMTGGGGGGGAGRIRINTFNNDGLSVSGLIQPGASTGAAATR
jgi:hypothetical protein